MARIDGQRGDHREDEPIEYLVEVGAIVRRERFPVAELDSLVPERGTQLFKQEGLLTAHHALQGGTDVVE